MKSGVLITPQIRDLLITILRNATYSTDQNANITLLNTLLTPPTT